MCWCLIVPPPSDLCVNVVIIGPLLGADADWEGPAAAIQREMMAQLMGGANAQSENLAPDAGQAFGLSPSSPRQEGPADTRRTAASREGDRTLEPDRGGHAGRARRRSSLRWGTGSIRSSVRRCSTDPRPYPTARPAQSTGRNPAWWGERLGTKIYVLHAFQTKAKPGIKTPQGDIDLIKRRYRDAKDSLDHWWCCPADVRSATTTWSKWVPWRRICPWTLK